MTVLREAEITTLEIVSSTNHTFHRNKRIRIAREIGFGKPMYAFVVDNKHRNGNEIHILTDTGLIVIINENTKKLITILIARDKQITRYFANPNIPELAALINLAQEHEKQKLNV